MSYDLPAPFIPYTRAHGRCGAAPHYSDVRQAQRAGYSCEQRDNTHIAGYSDKELRMYVIIETVRTLGHYHYDNHSMKVSKHS